MTPDTHCQVDQEGGLDMKSAKLDVKEYSYFAGNQWRKAADDKFFRGSRAVAVTCLPESQQDRGCSRLSGTLCAA
jgi:hypothetical protein